jgi:hypothetical protein
VNIPIVGTDNYDFDAGGRLVANQESANCGPATPARRFDRADAARLNGAIAAAVTWGFALGLCCPADGGAGGLAGAYRLADQMRSFNLFERGRRDGRAGRAALRVVLRTG